jgi:hypothetical protein
VVDGTALWFDAAGFNLLDVADDGVEMVIGVETSPALSGCSGCSTGVVPKDGAGSPCAMSAPASAPRWCGGPSIWR